MSDADAARVVLAQEHVRRGTEIVVAQRAVIDRLRLTSRSTEREERLLRTFEDTLSIFEEDLERLRAKVGG